MRWWNLISTTTAIVFRYGKSLCIKGKITQWQLDAITELLHAENLTEAEILVSRTGNTTFSKNIPTEFHQRIRNILAG